LTNYQEIVARAAIMFYTIITRSLLNTRFRWD
jgi:hypothetical protein